ncbi:hypothetical protein KCU83_g3701, partial [Aureobasidium melanogenum]
MKREASHDAEGGPAIKQARLSPSALDNDNILSLEVKDSAKTLFRRLCKDFGWSPTEPIRAKIGQLLSIDTSRSNLEPALFAFVQHLSFDWHVHENALFVGSRKVNGRVRLIWYKPSTPGASVGGSLWIDQTSQYHENGIAPYTPPKTDVVGQVLVDRFWPSFTTAFGLTSDEGNYKYISGVHTILLTFPRLRKSCTISELGRWAEGRLTTATDHIPLRKYELPFLLESVWMSKPLEPQRPQPVTPSEGSRSRPTVQTNSTTGRRSSVREIDRIQNIIQMQRKQLLTGIGSHDKRNPGPPQSSIAESGERSYEPLEFSETASEVASEISKNTSSKDNHRFEFGLNESAIRRMHDALNSPCIEISATESDAAANAKVEMTLTFDARVFRQQTALQLSSITSVESPPILPSRRAAIEMLCALAMETVVDDIQE